MPSNQGARHLDGTSAAAERISRSTGIGGFDTHANVPVRQDLAHGVGAATLISIETSGLPRSRDRAPRSPRVPALVPSGMVHARGGAARRSGTRPPTIVASLGVLVLGLACSGSSGEPMNSTSGDPPEVPPWACVPGETQPCPCEDGLEGLVTCDPQGAGFGACDCSPGAVSQGPAPTSTGSESGSDTASDTGGSSSGDTTAGQGSSSGEPDPSTSSGALDPTTSGGSSTGGSSSSG